jgi:LmbE family N-acetylglucosaminyl deacetylase
VAELIDDVPGVVLAVYAHPDDMEVAAGGTVARWAGAGSQVHVCICADGDKGSLRAEPDPAALVARRRAETVEAGRILGVAEHHWLGLADGEVDDSPAVRGRLVELIRRLRPGAVMAPDPTAVFFGQTYVNHRDHRSCGWAALDAVAPAAANPNYFPGPDPAHRVAAMYLSGTLEPDVWIDISASIEAKTSAIACHSSQLGDSSEWLRGAVRNRAEDAGRAAGVRLAEGFRRILLS